MIEQDYVDVESEIESDNKMDCTPSNNTQSKIASGEAPVHCTATQNNDLLISAVQQSDAELSKAFKEIIDLLEKVKKHHFPDRSAGPSFNDLRSCIVKFYDLANDADNSSRANLRLLAERLQSAQLMRKETITGLALKDDVRVLRDDLSKLTKTMTADNNSVSPSLENGFKKLREAVIQSLWSTSKDSQNLKQHISDLKGQSSEADGKDTATLHLLADELDTFRYELAMLRRDVTSVRVPGASMDISISTDLDALHLGVSTLRTQYGRHNRDAFTNTDISTLRDRIRILRGAASSIHDLLLLNEEKVHQDASDLQTNIGQKSKIRAIQVGLESIRDRIPYGPSPPLHHSLLHHNFAMSQREELALRQEMASLRDEKYSESDGLALWLLGPFDHDDSMKAKILDLCKKDPEFKDKLEACVSEETQGLPAAHRNAVDPAKDDENLSSADSEELEPKQTAADTEGIKPEQNTAEDTAVESEQSTLQRYVLEFERTFSGY